jgi:hypothetical protein
MLRRVGGPDTCQAESGPSGDTEIALPSLPTELAPLDLDRPLPAKILRLFIRENFLGIDTGVDGFQFRQTITSFSSSMP